MTLPRVLALCAALSWTPEALAQANELLFEGPKEAAIPVLMNAATALAARCEAYGITGVKGTAAIDLQGRNLVKLTHPQGFPEEKLPEIDFLASFPASRIELRILHKLSQADQAKHPVGGTPPEGASWIKFFDWERKPQPFETYKRSEREAYYLLRNQPILEASGKIKILRHDGKNIHRQALEAGVYLEFPKDLTQALHATVTKDPDKPDKELFLAALFVDGVKLDTGGGAMRWFTTRSAKGKTPDVGVWSIKELSNSRVLPFLLEHPLPFALKRAD